MNKKNIVFFKVLDFLENNENNFNYSRYDYISILNNKADYVDIYALTPGSLNSKIRVEDFGFFGVRYNNENFDEYIEKIKNSDMFKKYSIKRIDDILKIVNKINKKESDNNITSIWINNKEMSFLYEKFNKTFIKRIPFDKENEFYYKNLEEMLLKTIKTEKLRDEYKYEYVNYSKDVFIEEKEKYLIISDFLNTRAVELKVDNYKIIGDVLFYQTGLETAKTFMINLDNIRKMNFNLEKILSTKIILSDSNLNLSDIKEAGYKNDDFFKYENTYFSKEGDFFNLKDKDFFIKDKTNNFVVFVKKDNNGNNEDFLYDLKKNKTIISTKNKILTTDNLIIENTKYNNIKLYDKFFLIPLTNEFNLSYDLEEKGIVPQRCNLNININTDKIERFFKDGLFDEFLTEEFKHIKEIDLKGIEIKNENEIEIADDMNNKQQKNKNLKLK